MNYNTCVRNALIAILSLSWLVSACSGASTTAQPASLLLSEWKYSDLRLLDPADTADAAQDLIAAYLRRQDPASAISLFPSLARAEWQFRLELLEVEPQSAADIYLALDHAPGGRGQLPGGASTELEWDTLLLVPASGALRAWDSAFQPRQGLALRVLRDPELDTIDISLRAGSLLGLSGLRIQIFTAAPGSAQPVDASAVFSAYGAPPPPAQVLFAFWDVMPAYTPAQALRRWDGAHTGPYGGRHGLYNLLRTARNHQVPLALLDLKNPLSLSALEAVDGVNLVRQMSASSLLILPDVQPLPAGSQASPESAADLSRQAGLDFDLPASAWIYLSAGGSLSPGYAGAFLPLSGSSTPHAKLYRQGGVRWFVFPVSLPVDQAGVTGPSLEVRRALIDTAVQAGDDTPIDSSPILVLGGSLPESAWGDPARARQSFRYLTSRPWIRLLSSYDLLVQTPSTWRGANDLALSHYSPQSTSPILPPFSFPFSYEFYSLYAPVWPATPQLSELRSLYAVQQEILRIAEGWFIGPQRAELVSGCTQDLDGDEDHECVLVSQNVLAVFNPQSGALTYLFVREQDQLHQLVSPTSQLALGLSDPAGWDLSAGLNADPAVIPGAFAWSEPATQTELRDQRLIFRHPGLEQAYQLLPSGVHAEFTGGASVSLQIPLVLDPWQRFSPGWTERYSGNPAPEGWNWDLDGGPEIDVRTSALLGSSAFTESLSYLTRTEDPNRENPAGHYLPFPLALLEVGGQSVFSVDIELRGD